MKQKILTLSLALVIMSLASVSYNSTRSLALQCATDDCKEKVAPTPEQVKAGASSSTSEGGITKSDGSIECSILPKSICDASQKPELEQSGIWLLLLEGLKYMTVGIGIVAVGAISYAGFLYATAGDNSEQIKTSKNMIRNTAVGIVLYGLMYVAMQFLVPGGLFG